MSASKFASLHHGLLARKGGAAPAIAAVQPHVGYVDEAPLPLSPAPHDDAPLPARPAHAPHDTAPAASFAPCQAMVRARVSPAQKRRIRILAAELGMSQQALLLAALAHFFDRFDRA